MDAILLPDAFTPIDWYVAFHTRSVRRWVAWLALGRFKHVSCFAYCPGLKVWVVYDVQLSGTQIAVLAAHAAPAVLARYTEGAEVVRVKAKIGSGIAKRVPLPIFLCTTAVHHLLGLPGCALRPDTLYRQLLANGGTIVGRDNATHSGAGATGRSEPADRAGSGASESRLGAAAAGPGR